MKRTAWKWAAGAAALLLAQQGAIAANVDDLAGALAMPRAGSLVGAKQAARFAWVETQAGVRNIWIGGPDQNAHAVTAYTQDDGQLIYDLSLSRDGQMLAFVRGGDAEFPDGSIPNAASDSQWPTQRLFVMPSNGGPPQAIGEGHAPTFAADGRLAYTQRGEIWIWQSGKGSQEIAKVAGRVERLHWAPDGQSLLFVDARGDHAFVGLLRLGADHIAYLAPGLDFSVEPIFSPDGQQVALIQYRDPPADGDPERASYWSVKIVDLATGNARTLWTASQGEGGHFAPTRGRNLYWSADGQIVFPWERSGWRHVYAIDAKTGGAPHDLTPCTRCEVNSFQLGPAGTALYYVANVNASDRRHVWRTALSGGSPSAVTSGNGIESYPVFAGQALAVLATDASHPAHVALIAKGLGTLGPEPELTGGVTPQPVVFKAADGVTVHGQLFPGKGTGKHPALIFVHGGPRRQMLLGFHPMGYYSNAYILNQHFAAQGFDVLSVNYRSGVGYGEAFRNAPHVARDGAAEYRDVLAGGKWLAARSDVDPARIGIWGGSWGGYLTALALARNSDLFAAGVDFHGVHTMLRPLPKSLSPEAQAKARQLQWDSSPFGALDTWRSPVLLIHGDDDHSVDFYQSLLLARELTARNVPYQALVFPNERHGFLLHADWLASYRATNAFLDHWLKDKPDK